MPCIDITTSSGLGERDLESIPRQAAPVAADADLPPMAAPEDEEEAEEAAPAVADKDLPPMAALEDGAAPEETTEEEETAEEEDEDLQPAAAFGKRRPAKGFWTAMMAMLAVTGVQYPGKASGFTVYSCASAADRVDVYPLLETPAYPTTTISHQPMMRAADVADRVGTEMKCRALHDDEEKGGG